MPSNKKEHLGRWPLLGDHLSTSLIVRGSVWLPVHHLGIFFFLIPLSSTLPIFISTHEFSCFCSSYSFFCPEKGGCKQWASSCSTCWSRSTHCNYGNKEQLKSMCYYTTAYSELNISNLQNNCGLVLIKKSQLQYSLKQSNTRKCIRIHKKEKRTWYFSQTNKQKNLKHLCFYYKHYSNWVTLALIYGKLLWYVPIQSSLRFPQFQCQPKLNYLHPLSTLVRQVTWAQNFKSGITRFPIVFQIN